MGDGGKKARGKKEQRKKARISPKERRKLKREQKALKLCLVVSGDRRPSRTTCRQPLRGAPHPDSALDVKMIRTDRSQRREARPDL